MTSQSEESEHFQRVLITKVSKINQVTDKVMIFMLFIEKKYIYYDARKNMCHGKRTAIILTHQMLKYWSKTQKSLSRENTGLHISLI
jgi:hypothetical protein